MESMIFSKETQERITVKAGNGATEICVDVHGLSTKESIRLIRNIIALHREPVILTVIHGYVHGMATKLAIREKQLTQRDAVIIPNPINHGVTYVSVA